MNILFTKSRWEYGSVPLETYLDRVTSDGFDGVEIMLAQECDDDSLIRGALQSRDLFLIAQIGDLGPTVDDHLANLDKQMARAAQCGATLVNSHCGSDFFAFEENVRIFRHAQDLAAMHEIVACHETHRAQPLFSLPETLRYLDALPNLPITADFSHFMCVHESELRERQNLLDRVIARTRHIHARVGFIEGPQVADPFAPGCTELLDIYLGWWKAMVATIEKSGAAFATITPEAGPPPYMPVMPCTKMPLADAWTVNVRMKDWLKLELPN